jgi:serine/threonine-protein kinase
MTAAPESSAPTFRLPHRFGSTYLLFDRIGQGGMAEIFLARGKTSIGATRLAVVKLVLPLLASDSRFAAMLVAEAKLAAQLTHANVVQTYDLGREEGRLYIAMEYVEGFDLNELLRRCARAKLPLPAEFALFIVGETLRALDYAHRRRDADGKPLGIVHRDVSPSNVLISFEGEVKLCDFGIARAVSASADLTPEAIEGKAAYMSPEHARAQGIDGRSDIFAASIILYEMLAGRRLYKPAPGQDALAMAREAEIPPLPDRSLPDHARLAAIVARGLAVDPAQRYGTALAMVRDLDDYAMANRLIASPLKLGSFLVDNFGAEILEARRDREHAAAAIEHSPVFSFPPPNLMPPPATAAEAAAAALEGEQSSVRARSGEPSPARAPGAPPVAAPPAVPAAMASPPDADALAVVALPRPAPLPAMPGMFPVKAARPDVAPAPAAPARPVPAVSSAGSASVPPLPAHVASPSVPARRSSSRLGVYIALGGVAIAAAAATIGWLLAQH